MRTILNETVNAYHRVKNVRRSLRAVVGESRTEALSIEDYDTWIHLISDQQLVFEELKRLAPLANEALAGLAPPSRPNDKDKYAPDDKSVGGSFAHIESYLNSLVQEHRRTHNELKAAGSMVIQDPRLAKLGQFVRRGIRSGASERIADVVRVLRASLLRPT